ncbi:hypothetical protein [Eastern grey kangaroopox virus]|uniref:Uncharacterized protein n=1 Tax=Eastern grey kangaroopox virus TaxID=2042482 RepID=A0A2C9DSW8_9POXV|nr:hypothetical protein KM541_gp005 [Eastern grey kangaroopox virus]ATI21101.1 hypothetical protein [Eastern grey kangaroopox virus]ATX75004.1 hypothetical protein EKPV-NSW-ORF010 [Eastern grey kangaroopox virus]
MQHLPLEGTGCSVEQSKVCIYTINPDHLRPEIASMLRRHLGYRKNYVIVVDSGQCARSEISCSFCSTYRRIYNCSSDVHVGNCSFHHPESEEEAEHRHFAWYHHSGTDAGYGSDEGASVVSSSGDEAQDLGAAAQNGDSSDSVSSSDGGDSVSSSDGSDGSDSFSSNEDVLDMNEQDFFM